MSPVTHLPVQHGPHDHIERSLGDEVVNVYGRGLADAVRSVLCLLHVPGVPVELGKHHVRRRRQGQTLRTHTLSLKAPYENEF